jgi:signal transduction histidine kinase
LRAQRPELALLLGTLAAPFLPLPWSGLVLLALTALWVRLRPPRREVVVVLAATAVAVGALALRWDAERDAAASTRGWTRQAGRQYEALWQDLRKEAVAAAAALGAPPDPAQQAQILDAFNRLARLERTAPYLEPEASPGRRSLLLLDPDGAAVAWSGEGLLHEIKEDQFPPSGLAYQASFTAVTLLAVEPLPSQKDVRRRWRVVAGVSYSNDRLPFRSAAGRFRWSLIDRPEQAVPGVLQVPLQGAPTLVVERSPGEPGGGGGPGRLWALRLAWAAIAFSLLALAVMRGVGLAVLESGVLPPPPRERWAWVVALALSGVFAAGMAAALSPVSLAVLLLALALAAVALRRPRPFEETARRKTPSWGLAAGAAAVVLLFGAAWGLLAWRGALDLSSGILVPPEAFALRVAFAAAALALFLFAGRLGLHGRLAALPPDRWGWLGALCLLAGAALCDQPVAALPLLAAGGAAAAGFAGRRAPGRGMTFAALALLAVLAAAGAWETAYRLSLRAEARTNLLAALAPPTLAEQESLGQALQRDFESLDLTSLVVRSPAGLQRQDLAYALWRTSPLGRLHGLSAVYVQPPDRGRSSFSSGMTLTDEGVLVPLTGSWQGAPVSGQVTLRSGGQAWGAVRYWLLPLPDFLEQTGEGRTRPAEAEVGLLMGGPAADPFNELEAPVLYALYGPDGRAAFSPWDETPSLPRALRGAPRELMRAVVRTPTGRARAYARSTPGAGWQAVFLPMLTPLAALERTADFAVGVLLLLACVAPPALLMALPRAAFRDALGRTVRSYSRRLVLVYTVLLLLPLLLLNAVLVRSMEERLRREQRAAGEAALDSAQQILGERLLKSPPGFGIDTVFGDQLMSSLSSVVHHEINLYYGSSIYSSSRHELFTAGILPKRIPGEIYSRLALRGYGLWSRTNRVGGKTYLELYAPLRVPGAPAGEERLFLSMPLLAQQEQAARQLAHLRRQALLVTASLFVLLVAVGARLARNFTRPIMQLVEGTRRIAAGAPSLDLAPSELELAALVEAVDQMARHIAEGRERLVREKQVVERMVENITSGVVSLDREGRVLMRNRVAAELLGVEVGEGLESAVGHWERLAPVAAFLSGLRAADRAQAGEDGGAGEMPEMARATVRLPGGGGGEREWALIWVPVPGAGEPAALLVVEDATEVLRGQRLQAWAEMARIIAHEIKNPLTPIRLSAEHMREVFKNDPDHFGRVFDRCTSNILTQVEELRSIASEFSAYSAIPRIDPQPGDLTAAMAELVEGYRAAPPEGVSVELESDGPIGTRFDAKLLGRAVRNLLENALRATRPAGGRVVVRVERQNGHARIAVVDSGPGVRPDLLPRIFDPYFSTHDTGTGLGLAIARRIAEEHGGDITARNRAEGGLEVVVTLPIQG